MIAEAAVSLAPAKLNLALKVLGRRPDGYHELDSIMVRLSLADRLRVEFTAESVPDYLVTDSAFSLPDGFDGADNLVLKAAELYRARAGWPEGALRFFLEKEIPWGAGLGGGSSDAAAVLKILNRAAPEPLPEGGLLELGLTLGADVPFFLQPFNPARARGVGELLGPAPDEFLIWCGRALVLVNPGFAVPTPLVFKNLGLTNGAANNNLGSIAELAAGGNDLLAAALKAAPRLAEVHRSVESLEPDCFGLSGSGGTFWFYSRNRGEDMAALAEAQPAWWIREAFIV